MSVRIHRSSDVGWSKLPNELLRDPRMSARARGVLVTFLSHEDGWQQSVAFTSTEMTDGIYSVRAAIAELTELGYIVRTRQSRQGGRWTTDLHVYDRPTAKTDESTAVGDTDVGETDSRTDRSQNLEALDVEPLDEEHQGEHLAPLARKDELFEALCEVTNTSWRNGMTANAHRYVNAMLAQLKKAGATPDEIRRRAANWPYDAELTASALVKHWPSLDKVQERSHQSRSTQTGVALAQRLEAQGR